MATFPKTSIKASVKTTIQAATRLQDVALLAGVNMMTVSRVINHPEKVADATRGKVLAAIKKTGYVPNLMAGSLATNKSRIVGCIVPTIDNSIFSGTVRALTETLTANGYQLLLGQSHYDMQTEEQLVATFLSRKVDGLVLTGGRHSPLTIKRLKQSRLPVVETWDLPAKPIDKVAGFSNFDAGGAVAKYLLGKGYKKLCFVGGLDERSCARLAGFDSICPARHKPTVVRLAAGASFLGGRQVVADLVCAGLPDAIFFGNDALAAGAVMECHKRGISIPKQLAIMGFADLDIAASLEPALSTVRVPTVHMGEVAARLLLAKLNGESPSTRLLPKVHDLGFELVLRATA